MAGFRLVLALAYESWKHQTKPSSRTDYHGGYQCTWIPLMFGIWLLVKTEKHNQPKPCNLGE
jgi:hypothetical protein